MDQAINLKPEYNLTHKQFALKTIEQFYFLETENQEIRFDTAKHCALQAIETSKQVMCFYNFKVKLEDLDNIKAAINSCNIQNFIQKQ